jgi:hypothetical protein
MAEVMEIRESSIADPGPLGLAGFALTTFILSLSNAGLVPAALGSLFITCALFYGGGAQILAGMWEFKKNNTFGATAFTTYGSFWIALGTMLILKSLNVISFVDKATGKDLSAMAVGYFLVAFTIFTFYMWIGTFKTNNALLIVFTLLLVCFILLDLGHFGIMSNVAGGYVGLATAFVAWYTSAAGILNPMFGRIVLPVGPRK